MANIVVSAQNDPYSFGQFTTAGFAVLSGMTLNEWAAAIGIFVALAGLVINVWHKRKMIDIAERQLALAEAAEVGEE